MANVVLMLLAVYLGTPQPPSDQTYPCFTHRGRLSHGNGPPVIWLVGTKRIVAVEDGLPEDLEKLVEPYLMLPSEQHGDVFGDFEICPVEADRPGHRRNVLVKGAHKLVVVFDEELRRAPLKLLTTWPKGQ